jgi:hypothetical protein
LHDGRRQVNTQEGQQHGPKVIGPSIIERLKLARRAAPKVAAPDGGWQIRIRTPNPPWCSVPKAARRTIPIADFARPVAAR